MLMPLSQAQRARFATRATWLSVVGLLLVPLVVGGLLTWALWDPENRLDRISAAIVNQDEPVQIDGQTVPLGRQLAAALVTGEGTTDAPEPAVPNVSGSGVTTTFDWVLSDAADAADGLATGRYDVVLTIPADFSAKATSSADAAAAERATFDVTTSTRARPMDGALAQVLAVTAADVLGTQLTEGYLSQVLVSFTTLSDNLAAAADGATELAGGAGELSAGTSQLAGGAADLSGGLGELSDGTYTLASGLSRLADGAGSLSGGLSELSAGTGDLAAGLGDLDGGAAALAAGLAQTHTQVAGSAQQAADGVAGAQQLAGGLAQSSAGANDLAAGTAQLAATGAQLDAGLQQVYTDARALAGACAAGDAGSCAALDGLLAAPQTGQLFGGLGQLATGLADTDAGAQALADGLVPLAAAGDGIASGAQASATGLAALAAGLAQLSGGAAELADGAGDAAGGARDLAAGATDAAAGAGDLAGGAEDSSAGAMALADGASDAASGAGELADGADRTADGAAQLADGATELAGGLGTATDQLPAYTQDEADALAAVIADPVEATESSVPLGTAAVPMLMALALWLGSMATYLVLSPLGRQALGSPRSSLVQAWLSFWPAAGIGVGQAVVLTAVMGVPLGLDAAQWVRFGGLAVLAAIALTAVNQGLAALLGGVGRFVAVVVAAVTLATGVISTAPSLLTGVAGLLPTAPLVDGLRAAIQDESGLAGAAVLLVLWGVAGLAAATAAIARRRVVDIGALARWSTPTPTPTPTPR